MDVFNIGDTVFYISLKCNEISIKKGLIFSLTDRRLGIRSFKEKPRVLAGIGHLIRMVRDEQYQSYDDYDIELNELFRTKDEAIDEAIRRLEVLRNA